VVQASRLPPGHVQAGSPHHKATCDRAGPSPRQTQAERLGRAATVRERFPTRKPARLQSRLVTCGGRASLPARRSGQPRRYIQRRLACLRRLACPRRLAPVGSLVTVAVGFSDAPPKESAACLGGEAPRTGISASNLRRPRMSH
jgi:hypothetical protein